MFYNLAPSKGLNPRKFCWWDPRSGIFYLWNLESWALESRIQPKKSRIPLTSDIQFHLQRRESSTWNPECKAWNPEPRTVLRFLVNGANRPIQGRTDLYMGQADPYIERTDLYIGRTDPYMGQTDPYIGRTVKV